MNERVTIFYLVPRSIARLRGGATINTKLHQEKLMSLHTYFSKVAKNAQGSCL